MIIGVLGTLGSGKTTTAVYILYKYFYPKMPVFSNIWLSFGQKIQNPTQVVELENCALFLDDIYAYLDARLSQKNVYLADLMLRVRKQNVHLIYTAPFQTCVDLRLRFNTDIFMFPKINLRKTRIKVTVVEPNYTKTFKFNPRPYFVLFDTKEVVQRPKIQKNLSQF